MDLHSYLIVEIILNKFAPKIFNLLFKKKYMSIFFTANQANDALPDVIKKFEYILATQNEVKKQCNYKKPLP